MLLKLNFIKKDIVDKSRIKKILSNIKKNLNQKILMLFLLEKYGHQ